MCGNDIGFGVQGPISTCIDRSATYSPVIWADSDIDSKCTMAGCDSSNPTSTSMLGWRQEIQYIFLFYLANGKGVPRFT